MVLKELLKKMTNQFNELSQVICPNCNQIYQFEKIGYITNITCPYCYFKFVISDEDKVVYRETKLEHNNRILEDFLTFRKYQHHIIILVSICCVFGMLFAHSYINPQEYTEPELEPIFMEGIGYEFTDEREPTDNELFEMEESLNLCYNPTYNEVVSFIEDDDLDDYTYEEWFDCDEYSFTLINSSRTKKIRACFVVIYPTERETYDLTDEQEYQLYLTDPSPHAVVVFNTTDKGLIFVEPQLDDIFTYKEFEKMKKKDKYYAEDNSYIDYLYSIEMDFDHYTIDWFYWYFDIELMQTWNLYKNEYPYFKSSYDEYFVYE